MFNEYKHYTEIKSLNEADMPSTAVLNNPKTLTIEGIMAGKYVGVQWTHYSKTDNGKSVPRFLMIKADGHSDGFIDGLKAAQKWIKEIDAELDKRDEAPEFPWPKLGMKAARIVRERKAAHHPKVGDTFMEPDLPAGNHSVVMVMETPSNKNYVKAAIVECYYDFEMERRVSIFKMDEVVMFAALKSMKPCSTDYMNEAHRSALSYAEKVCKQ